MAEGRTQEKGDQPPSEPILRINTTAHAGPIIRIATDRENRYAATTSYDKTARVWSLPDGLPVATLRVPIGEGDIGKLYAVAITPDGSTVALGGYTKRIGSDVYLFDRTAGGLQRRLSGLPNVVNHAAYSPSGRLFAVALGESNGIRLYDVDSGYEPLPSDNDYGDDSYSAEFDQQSRLVTTSWDGFIRLYAAGQNDKPIAKVKGRGGTRPFSAVFSPDGSRIAVGYDRQHRRRPAFG
jgi:WD40 repeat protein